MLFNSYVFVVFFLPLILLGWWGPRAVRTRLTVLTLGSWVFYAWWDWRFVPLMVASTAVDFVAGHRIAASDQPAARRRWLIGSLVCNLGVLGFFKYYTFVGSSLNGAGAMLGLDPSAPSFEVVLPIGISFYTFNSMSYTIDVYRGAVRPAASALHFAAFVAAFPHLVAGPIVRWSDIGPQLERLPRRLGAEQAARGAFFLAVGMVEKVLIADRLAPTVNAVFAEPAAHGAGALWLALIGYTLQLYFDFAGYSDMAVGLAHLLGLQFPQNFDAPYQATNIAEFWRRWHMSLSFWLRDYVYTPLGGSRGTSARTTRNLMLTMVAGGLWHGANWPFVVWGLYHGALLAGYHALRRSGRLPATLAGGRLAVFLAFALGLVLFRAESLSRAGEVLWVLAGGHGLGDFDVPATYVPKLVVALFIAHVAPSTWQVRLAPRPAYGCALAMGFAVAVLYLGEESPFLYFQF